MPRTINFIDSVLRNIKPTKARTVYWCEGSPGFGLRVTPTGTKTFVYKYMARRKSRWLTIGKYPKHSIREARAEYNALYEKVMDYGRDPIEEHHNKKEREQLFETLIEEYLEIGRLKGKKFVVEEERYFKTDILPVLGKEPLDRITPDDINQIQKNIIDRSSKCQNATRSGRVSAKHAIGCIRRVLDLACKKGLIDQNPVHKVDPLGVSGKRDRVLSFQEIWMLWHGLEDTNVPLVTANAIKFMLASMQRGIEVRNMRYNAIKADENIWQMEMDDTKNRQMHRVPLNKIALDLIEQVKPFTGQSDYVFGATRANNPPKQPSPDLKPSTSTSYSQAMRRCRRELGITNICPHDLRRSGATWITAAGLPKLYARLMLNHSDGDRDVTGEVYVQYSYDFEKRRAAEVWNYVLGQIINAPTPSDIPKLETLRECVMSGGLKDKSGIIS